MPDNPHLENFVSYLAAGADILDFGCGVGNSAAMMRDKGFSMTCMDASTDMIEAAGELHGLEVIQKNFSDLDAAQAFDGIWASYSLLHAPKAEMPANLERIVTALRPGGILYIGLKLGDKEERDAVGRFYAYYTEAELSALLRAAGLVILDCRIDQSRGMLGKMDKGLHMIAKRPD
jgi:trans-aconitate methyltransferase